MSVKKLVLLRLRWIPAALSSLMCRKDGQSGQQNPWASCFLIFLDPPRRALRKRSRKWEGSSSNSSTSFSDVPSGLAVLVTNFFYLSFHWWTIIEFCSLKNPLEDSKGKLVLQQEQVLHHKIYSVISMNVTHIDFTVVFFAADEL